MAIYHLSTKPISRSAGRSATAAAAYRAGDRITDERTGEIHDYTRKRGVKFAEIVAPAGVGDLDREALWNAAELAEKRRDARVAREFEIALPEELPATERRRIAVEFARELVDRYGVAADVAIHAPSRGGDERNHHVHILCTTRKVKRGKNGKLELGEKASIELSDKKRAELGLPPAADEITEIRALWAQIANRTLERHGYEHIDHRSLKDQGITDRLPQVHFGPAATRMHRRGVKSEKWLAWERANEALRAAAEAGKLAREMRLVDREIIDLSTTLSDLKREREERRTITAEPGKGGHGKVGVQPAPSILVTPSVTTALSPSERAFLEFRNRFPDAEWAPASDPQPKNGCVLKGHLTIKQLRHSIYESLDGKALVISTPLSHMGLSIRVEGDASSAREFVAAIVTRRERQGLTTRVNGIEHGRGLGR